MSEQPEVSTLDRPPRRVKEKAKKAGALAMAIGALSGLAAPAARAEQIADKKARIEHVRRPLKNPSELPGIKIHLGKEILEQLKDSTVELGVRYRPDLPGGDPNQPFIPFCTAVKVQVEGDSSTEFATAAHCMGSITGVKYGAFRDQLNLGIKAENYTALSQVQFAILDPNEYDVNSRSSRPVALVDQISVNTDDKDTALLRASAIEYSDSSTSVRALDEIPALEYKALKKRPLPGTPVALYGVPAASNFEPITSTGVYLGRVLDEYHDENTGQDVARFLDIVGISPDVPQTDGCNFGASGSVAELPDGQILGNLSIRDNLGYGPVHSMEPGDLSLEDNWYWVSQWQNQLGIDMSSFTTICGYTVLGPNTPRQMVSGFDTPAIAKGADPRVNGSSGKG